jgi:cathepsin B
MTGKEICIMHKFCEEFTIYEDDSKFINHEDIINTINNSKTSWIAGKNSRFDNMNKGQIKSIMGTVVDTNWTFKLPTKRFNFRTELPSEFDARKQWPNCASVIGHIRDQANCGSCWAHGTTEAFNDRACINSNGSFKTLLSVSDTTGCCGFLSCFSMGCKGGQIGSPWSWFKSTGVVTGGDFGDKSTCYPYTMPECNHHVPGTHQDCSKIKEVDPKCTKTCQDSKIT